MKYLPLCVLLLLLGRHHMYAQADEARLKELRKLAEMQAEETPDGWKKGGGIGFDLAQLAIINPRVGGGSNRLGFGGLGSFFANYKKGRLSWDNSGSFQVSVQRIGSRVQPFEKNIDVLRLGSRLGYRTGNEKLFAAAEATFESLLFKTYEGNILKSDTLPVIARFGSPLRTALSTGINYKPDDRWSIYAAPATMRLIYVADDAIAARNVHGNEEGKNSFLQFGANLNAVYQDKYFEEKMSVKSSLDLFSNYLKDPQRIDVLWQTDIGWELVKNVSLNLHTELFYDYDVRVQYDANKNGIYEDGELARKPSFTEALLIKYNYVF